MGCPICYEESTEFIKSSCNHSFCKKCYDIVVLSRNICPMCRGSLETEENLKKIKYRDERMNVLMMYELTKEDDDFNEDLFNWYLSNTVSVIPDIKEHLYNFNHLNHRGLTLFFNSEFAIRNCHNIDQYELNRIFKTLYEKENYVMMELIIKLWRDDQVRRKIIGNEEPIFVYEFLKSIVSIKTGDPEDKYFYYLKFIKETFFDRFDDKMIEYAIHYNSVKMLAYIETELKIDIGNPDLFCKLYEDDSIKCTEDNFEAIRFMAERFSTVTDYQMNIMVSLGDMEIVKIMLPKYGVERSLSVCLTDETYDDFEEIDGYITEEQRKYLIKSLAIDSFKFFTN